MHLVIGAIVVALALLAFALYKQYKKTEGLSTDLEALYKKASDQLAEAIEKKNAAFHEQLSLEVQQRLQDAGVNKQQIADLNN